MTHLKTIIIDDEQHAIDSLLVLCVNLDELDIVKTFSDSQDAFIFVKSNPVDLILIDIRMPRLSGMEFAGKLDDLTLDIPLIFTTAYDEYVLDALRKNALDYLLKPISFAELKQAVDRLQKQKATKKRGQFRNSRENEKRKLLFNTRSGFITVSEKEIIYIQAEGVYSKIYLKNGKEILISKNLGTIEKQLQMSELVKIHRSFIVNILYIFEVFRSRKECVLFVDDQKIILPVSASGIKQIENLIG